MTTIERHLEKQEVAEIKNYTRIPNMLIFGYQDILSPQEKWLLVCLKHLCGRKGTRHLSLRYISEQTGISTGALSSSKDKKGKVNPGMIMHLHTSGLIHAEVKKHQGKGNPQFHITITDVWELNQAFFDKACSDFGQDETDYAEPVRNSDAPVQISDKLVQISDEPVRNSANTNIRYKTITNTTEQDESISQDATALATHALESVIEAEMSSQSTKGRTQNENDSHSHDGSGNPARRLSATGRPGTQGPTNGGGVSDAQPLHVAPARPVQTPRPSSGTGDHPVLPQELTPPVVVESPLSPLVATPTSLDTDTPVRPQRKPKPVKEDNTPTPERIEAVFACMEATIRRLTEQQDFTFGRTKKAKEAVKDLLTGRVVTPEKMDWHICRLWNKPKDAKSGFYWQENMSVVAICNNYDREIVNYRPARAMNSPTMPAVPSGASLIRVSPEQRQKNIDTMMEHARIARAAQEAAKQQARA